MIATSTPVPTPGAPEDVSGSSTNDTAPGPGAPAGARRRRVSGALYGLGAAAAVSIVWFSVVRGRALQRAHPEVLLGAAPLVGRDPRDGWDWRFGAGLVVAAVIAGSVVAAVRSGWVLRAR
ncbi:MAG: hypothetical protein ABMA25_21525, partial [Ilumatobacteraceae bacterium]